MPQYSSEGQEGYGRPTEQVCEDQDGHPLRYSVISLFPRGGASDVKEYLYVASQNDDESNDGGEHQETDVT